VEVPLGSLCGDVIEKVMVAYDTRKGGGPFELLFDDVAIRSQLSTAGWQVQANPVGGDLEISQVITIQSAADVVVHYTLDGSNPTLESSHYTAPLTLPRKGPVELRYAPVGLDGAISSAVFSAIYEVR
jgi:hypothetical protein